MKIDKNKEGKLFIISAPSGGGKTTLINCIIQKLSVFYPLAKVITYTSRIPRINEIEGKDYHFISRHSFLKKINENFFLETNIYNGELYGSPVSIKNQLIHGQSLIMTTDRNGAKNILTVIKKPILIWIFPPSLAELKKRLKMRGTESATEIEMRMQLAQQEILAEEQEKLFDYHLVNNNLQETLDELCSIIIKKLT